MKYLSIIILCFTSLMLKAQMIEKAKKGPFLLTNATIHTITNGVIEGDVLIEGDRIKQIGKGLSKDQASIIDCTGKHIYPGMIDGGTKLGLSEISAVSLTNDYNELGDFTPHMEALTAVNPNSVNIPVTRTNGVTTVLAKPTGGLFPGRAALIDLFGYTPESMYAGFKGQILQYPSTGKRGRWDRRKDDEIKKDAEKAMKKLNDFWSKCKTYAAIDSASTASGGNIEQYNPQLEAMTGVVRKEEKLMIRVNKKEDILSAIKFVNKHSIDAVLVGVIDGWRVADSLVKYNIPVITGPILALPSRDSDRYDAAYTNAGKLHKAGVLVAIQTNETENVRNLPFNAAFAANYGMGVDAAMEAITINAAKVFGLEDELGSIEEGKRANLYVADGDPFETKTQISHLFIGGFMVPMENRHTLLNDEFLDRFPSNN